MLDENKPSHETDAFDCFVNECVYACSSVGHDSLLEEREQIHLKKLLNSKYFPSFIEFKYQLDV